MKKIFLNDAKQIRIKEKKRHRMISISLLLFVCFIISACQTTTTPPVTYVETAEPGWKVISLREELQYNEAWQLLVDRIRKKYDIEILDKDSGYLRTGWIYTTGGSVRSDYKTRIIAKFSPDKRHVELKVDALFHKLRVGAVTGDVYADYGWIPGIDTQLLDDVYGDLSALLGRVRR